MRYRVKKWFVGLLSIAIILSVMPMTAMAEVAPFPEGLSGGGKSADDPYLIEDAEQLRELREYVNEGHDCKDLFFRLTADVNLGGDTDNKWTPIGWNGGRNDRPFNGTFDGGSFIVGGLYINESHYSGLFGYIGENGTVKNLTVEGEVSGTGSPIGGIAGRCDGSIENCKNAATITGSLLIGGIVGETSGSVSIRNCINVGEVNGTSTYIGGIVGKLSGDFTISGCKNTGKISGEIAHVGGIVGGSEQISSAATIENCHNTGEVTVTSSGNNVGGIVGWNADKCTVTDCSSSGKVSGGQFIGGIVGSSKGTVKNCYNTGEISGLLFIGGSLEAAAPGQSKIAITLVPSPAQAKTDTSAVSQEAMAWQ